MGRKRPSRGEKKKKKRGEGKGKRREPGSVARTTATGNVRDLPLGSARAQCSQHDGANLAMRAPQGGSGGKNTRSKKKTSWGRRMYKIKERHLRDGGDDVPAVCSICLTDLQLAIDPQTSLRQCPHCRKLLHTGCLRRCLAGYLDTREPPTCPNCKRDVAGYRHVGDDGYDYDDDAWSIDHGDLVQNVEDDFDSDYEP